MLVAAQQRLGRAGRAGALPPKAQQLRHQSLPLKEARPSMANQTRRLRPEELEADHEAVVAVQSITTYKPLNIAYSAGTLMELNAARDAAQRAEILAQQALATARDIACAAEWALHNAVLGARTQVRAQYGDDSNELQAMGLKKRSDRKRPARPTRSVPTAASNGD